MSSQTSPKLKDSPKDGYFGTRAGKKVILVRKDIKSAAARAVRGFDSLP